MPTFSDLKSDYENLWAHMAIRADKAEAVTAIARKLIAKRGRYTPVAARTGVPWLVIRARLLRDRKVQRFRLPRQGDQEPVSLVLQQSLCGREVCRRRPLQRHRRRRAVRRHAGREADHGARPERKVQGWPHGRNRN